MATSEEIQKKVQQAAYESTRGPENLADLTSGWKGQALKTLDSYYKGDIQDVVSAVRAGNRPSTKGLDYAAQNKQNFLFDAVKQVVESEDRNKFERDSNPSNPYLDPVIRSINLGESRSIEETLLPNFSYRKNLEGANKVSEGIGLAQDVLSIPTRALTAGVGGFTPEGEYLTFEQRMGRPDQFSGPGERFMDFAASGAGGRSAIKAGEKVIGKALTPLARGMARADNPLVRKFGRLSGYTDPATSAQKAVMGFGGPTRAGRLESAAKGFSEGMYEGLASSTLPAAFTATDPENPNAGRDAATELAFGSILGGGIGAAKGGIRPGLTPYGKELAGGTKATRERILEAAKGYDPGTSAKTRSKLKDYQNIVADEQIRIDNRKADVTGGDVLNWDANKERTMRSLNKEGRRLQGLYDRADLSEADLEKAAEVRLFPNTRAEALQDIKRGIKEMDGIFKRYGFEADMDYLTPAVVRKIRGSMKDVDAKKLDAVLSIPGVLRYLGMQSYKLPKGMAGSVARGTGPFQAYGAEYDFGFPEESPEINFKSLSGM